jgi:hypothetical protein
MGGRPTGDIEGVGRLGNMLSLGDRNKDAKLFEGHADIPLIAARSI